MARRDVRGWGSPRFPDALPFATGRLRAHRRLFPAFLLCSLALLFSAPAAAQGSPDDEVHVRPRTVADKPPAPPVTDPNLKTHTKPLKVDVDLVLVNVTVTDPMNRLVTGLDREN